MSNDATRPLDQQLHPDTVEPADDPRHAPTLADDYLHSACTLARGRASWTPGPGHSTEDLPWLKGAAA